MANRAWRNELNNRSYMYGSTYGAPINYSQNLYDDRRNFGSRGGYQDDIKRGKRVYDAIEVSPKKPGRENNNSNSNQGSFRRNYVPPVTANSGQVNVTKKTVAKYSVKPPRVTFDLKEGSIAVLRSRYPKLYIPSDFFHSDFRWQDVFPLYTPLSLAHKTKFQTFHRDVEPLVAFDNSRLEPADANYTYSAKVMLLESLNLVKSVCEFGGVDKKSIYKSLNFLVGTKSKNEPLAIGGPWSPSLDGPNPDEDPQVLINTAIRTCRELTAIDLTPCREWYRFVEYHYYRPADRQGLVISTENDESRTESENNFRVETVVIFVPSVWDCMPDEDTWEDMKTSYSMALEGILAPPQAAAAVEVLQEPAVEIMEQEDCQKKEEGSEEAEQQEPKPEENKVEQEKTEEVAVSKVEEKVVLSEKEKKRLELLYKMTETSSIVVHPNKTAKNGKFHCQFMSLGHLLEYRTDDQKEHTFEVSMFAEQFQEMLHRDAAFNIYRALLRLPKQADLDCGGSEPEAKRRREEAAAGDSAKQAGGSKIEQDLLYSFCTFDTDHAAYIKEHDLEDIIQSVGLELSRAQARRLIAKAVNRKGSVYYRELTMATVAAAVGEQGEPKEESEVAVAEEGGAVETAAAAVAVSSDMELSKGNRTKLVKMSEESTVYLDTAKATADKIHKVEAQLKTVIADFNTVKVEIDSERKVYHLSKDVENGLRAELKDLESQLYNERKGVREATQTQEIYGGLLRMARDVLERAKSKIDRQFEKEAEKDRPKEQQEATVVAAAITNGN